MSDPKAMIAALAAAAGFDVVRVTVPAAIPDHVAAGLDEFLASGHHGDMGWMAATADRRRHPSQLWPEARSIVMLGMNYGPDYDPLDALARKSNGVISCYAKGRDYHDVIKKKLKQVAGELHRRTGSDVKVFVDTAPLMEKPAAAAAGIGWQGKHSNLVSKDFGSWLFLGAILTTAQIAPDASEEDHCGSCRRCLDICPTGAFPAPYKLEARRCISYLTIEHRGMIPRKLRRGIGNRIYGCDDCLAVCPWNKFAQAAGETRFAARAETENPPLAELLALDDAAFRARFAGTPVKRTGRDRFLRNVLIAAGNSGDATLVPSVERLLEDAAPLVRAGAVWACLQLLDRERFEAQRARHLPAETDPMVAVEWRSPLATEAKEGDGQ